MFAISQSLFFIPSPAREILYGEVFQVLPEAIQKTLCFSGFIFIIFIKLDILIQFFLYKEGKRNRYYIDTKFVQFTISLLYHIFMFCSYPTCKWNIGIYPMKTVYYARRLIWMAAIMQQGNKTFFIIIIIRVWSLMAGQ